MKLGEGDILVDMIMLTWMEKVIYQMKLGKGDILVDSLGARL